MDTTTERPRILTENEKWGNSVLDENGGTWLVVSLSNDGDCEHVAMTATNRQAAEDYIYAKCEEYGLSPETYSLSVWTAHETWPPEGD